jgi:ribosomal protein L37AE/L43A
VSSYRGAFADLSPSDQADIASWTQPPEPACEDCGEPATRQTADGVWLCDGDFDLLLERAFWTEERESHL